MLQEVSQIGEACVKYYEIIYATYELQEMIFAVFDKIMPKHVLDTEMIECLQSDVTRDEITQDDKAPSKMDFEALSAIQDDKTPGNDGSSYFFK